MMHPISAAAVTLSGRDGLLSAVPPLLGFHPADSLVLVCLSGTNRRVGPVVRVDLSPTASPTGSVLSTTGQVLAALMSHAARYADEVAVIVYTDHPDIVDLDTAAAALGRVCPVLDAVIVPNAPHPISGELLAATVGHGRAVLADRDEVARSVEHRSGLTTAPILAELDTIAGRDVLIAHSLPDPDAVATLVTAAQSTPDADPRTGDVCAALAVLAYRHGSGALAQVAVDRALRTAPGHRLAHLILAVMAEGLPPADLDALITDQQP